MRLRFECLGKSCNRCCTGGERGAYVHLTDEDFRKLGSRINEINLTRWGGELCMYLPPGELCAFWEEGEGCTVRDRAPFQCRSYPLWKPLVENTQAWEAEKERCPGIGQGKRIPRHRALRVLRDDRTDMFVRRVA